MHPMLRRKIRCILSYAQGGRLGAPYAQGGRLGAPYAQGGRLGAPYAQEED